MNLSRRFISIVAVIVLLLNFAFAETIDLKYLTNNQGPKLQKISDINNITSIKFPYSNIQLTVGRGVQLRYTTVPAGSPVVWTSSNSGVATVNSGGYVTARKSGTTTIKALSTNSIVNASLTVTVVKAKPKPKPKPEPKPKPNPDPLPKPKPKPQKISVEKVEIHPQSLALTVGDNYPLDVKLYPDNASDKDYKYYVSNPEVLTIENGYVIAKEEGEATIFVKADGAQSDIRVQVFAWVEANSRDKTPIIAMPFKDIDNSDTYYKIIKYLYNYKLMSGVDSDIFDKDGQASRAMLLTALYRLEGSPDVTYYKQFEDVEYGSWYSDAVMWGKSEEITAGITEKLFAPNRKLTRQELVVFIYNYIKYKNVPETFVIQKSKPTDFYRVDFWAKEEATWCLNNRLIGLNHGRFDPHINAKRQDIARALYVLDHLLTK